MPEDKKGWAFESAADLEGFLDWGRRRMNVRSKGLILVAIGLNSVAFAKEPGLSVEDAIRLLEDNLQTLKRGLKDAEAARVTRGSRRRQDVG
jgi:hypothetical protein